MKSDMLADYEIKRDIAGAKKRRRSMRLVCVFLIVFGGLGLFLMTEWRYAHRSIAGIREPIQVDINEAVKEGRVKEIHKTIDAADYRVEMDFLAEYDIEGLVVTLDSYDGADAGAFDMAIPRDISLAWGKAAEYASEIDWGHAARTLSYKYSWETLKKAGISSMELAAMASNNHMIVEDGKLREELKRVKRGDHIKMTGYLVSADIYDRYGSLVRRVYSSLTRTDHSEHPFDTRTSCEIMYLTSLSWL